MAHSVRHHLRLEIDAYDATIRRFIPGYETMIARAAQAVAEAHPGRAVDLGAGTGALSEAVLEATAEPGGTVVELLDVDPEMLGRARGRLARFGDRAVFTQGSFDGALPACDAAMASLSLHHVPTLEEKGALFRRVADALPPGGLFVNGDATMPEDSAERDALYAAWAAHMATHGIDAEQARRHFAEWAEEDTYLPLDAELAALDRAGFEASCTWRDGPITLVVARRR